MTFCASVVELVVTGGVVGVNFVAGGGVVLQDKVNNRQISNKSPVSRMAKSLDVRNSVSCFKVIYFILPDTQAQVLGIVKPQSLTPSPLYRLLFRDK